MAVADYFDTIQKIYIAFYQRPADPAGLKYWAQRVDAANGSLAEVIDAFANSAEAAALYGEITGETIGDIVDAIYQALFNRAPDAAGKQFYVDAFNAGEITAGKIALAVLDGSQGDDLVAINNKLAVANIFTAKVDGRPLSDAFFGTGTNFDVTYNGNDDAAAARTILAAVTSNPSTVLNESGVVAALQEKIADAGDAIGGVASGQTFTLTAGVDDIPGTAGNDTINAPLAVNPATGLATIATLSSFDSIDGGAGNDTLNVFFTGAVAALPGATVKNVENVNFNVDNAFAGDISSWTGVQNVTLTQTGTAAAQSLTVKGATTVAVKGGSTVAVTDTSTTPADRGATVTTVSLDGNTGAATLHGDGIKTLNISNTNQAATVNAKAGTRELAVTVDKVTGGTITDGEATTVVLNTKGAVSGGFTVSAAKATAVTINAEAAIGRADPALAGVTLTVGEAKSLTVNGSAAVKVETSTLTKVETISAAASTGGVEIVDTLGNAVVFTGGEGKDKVTVGATTKTINMGGGDDTVVVTGALGTGGKLDGGAGSNTIQATAAVAQTLTATDTFSKAISNFQKLSVGSVAGASDADAGVAAANATNTINMANAAGIAYVVSAGTDVAPVTADADEAGRLVINNLANGGTFELTGAINGVSQVNIKDASTNAADVLNIKLNGATNIVNAAATTVAGVETININATNSGKFGPAAASTILLNAADATKVVVTGNHGIDFTGSTLSKLAELDASGIVATGAEAATAAQIATAGAVTFTAAATNDNIVVKTGNGADVINLASLIADGNAAIATKGATVSTGAGNDIVTGSRGKDVIDLGAGNDRVISSGSADTITLGAGNDAYRLQTATDSTIGARDVITDFQANTVAVSSTNKLANATVADRNGDVIEINSALAVATTSINFATFDNAADATTFLSNSAGVGSAGNVVNVAFNSSTGFVYIDLNDDGIANSVIELTGVTSLTEAAFFFAA